MNNQTITVLPLVACHLIDLPDTGEAMDFYSGSGHITCFILGLITFIFGAWGTFANILIILILKKQNSGKSFDTFLIGLACFDLLGSVTSVMAAISTVALYQNWNRGLPSLVTWYIGTYTMFWSRSGSSFMTLMITVERFIVVAFPLKSIDWYTAKVTRNLAIGVAIFSFLLAVPRYTSNYIDENTVTNYSFVPTKDLTYTYYSTSLEKFWYVDTMRFFDWIDFWVPLPVLLFFNLIMYYHIRKFAARRKTLNLKHQKDIHAAKMFVPVVIVLFLCNIGPIVNNFFLFSRIVYREAFLGILVSVTVNSAVNLPIYYFRGSSFRKEARTLLSSCCLSLEWKESFEESMAKEKTNTKTTSGSQSAYHGNSCESEVENKYI